MAAATVPRCWNTLSRNRPTSDDRVGGVELLLGLEPLPLRWGRIPKTMSRIVSLSRTGQPSMGRMAPCSRMHAGNPGGDVKVGGADAHRVAQEVVEVQAAPRRSPPGSGLACMDRPARTPVGRPAWAAPLPAAVGADDSPPSRWPEPGRCRRLDRAPARARWRSGWRAPARRRGRRAPTARVRRPRRAGRRTPWSAGRRRGDSRRLRTRAPRSGGVAASAWSLGRSCSRSTTGSLVSWDRRPRTTSCGRRRLAR